MRTKDNWTPSDYELEFNYDAIPRNIHVDSAIELSKAVNRKSPLSRKIHIMLDENGVNLRSRITVSSETIVSQQGKDEWRLEYK